MYLNFQSKIVIYNMPLYLTHCFLLARNVLASKPDLNCRNVMLVRLNKRNVKEMWKLQLFWFYHNVDFTIFWPHGQFQEAQVWALMVLLYWHIIPFQKTGVWKKSQFNWDVFILFSDITLSLLMAENCERYYPLRPHPPQCAKTP